jgi:hypothetical protein
MLLRELEGEVLENVAPNLLIARYLQQRVRILFRFNWCERQGTREGLFRISNFSYSVALSAAHK